MRPKEPERIIALPVIIESKTDDGAYEDAHIDTASENRVCEDVFTPEQIQKIGTMLREDESIKGFYIDDYTYFSTTGSKFARVKVYMDLSSGERICLHNYEDSMGSGRPLVVDYKKFELRRQRDPEEVESKKRYNLHKKIAEQTIIQGEEPVNIRDGFITLDDLVVLRAGTYAEHSGDIYGVHYHEKTELPHQTLLFPFTIHILSRLPENDFIRKIKRMNQDTEKYCNEKGVDAMVNLSFIDALSSMDFINPLIVNQGLELQLPRKEPLEVLFCTPPYIKVRNLPPCMMPISRNRYGDEVEYLNIYAGAGIGVIGGPHWYREDVTSHRHEVLFEVVSKNK